jgi:hypothetical protein
MAVQQATLNRCGTPPGFSIRRSFYVSAEQQLQEELPLLWVLCSSNAVQQLGWELLYPVLVAAAELNNHGALAVLLQLPAVEEANLAADKDRTYTDAAGSCRKSQWSSGISMLCAQSCVARQVAGWFQRW